MSDPASGRSSIEVSFAYTAPAEVSPDAERRGLLRARTRPERPDGSRDGLQLHRCPVRDWNEEPDFRPSLLEHGFDCVALPDRDGLLERLARVREAGVVHREDAAAIRRGLAGATLRLGDGSRLRLLTIAPEGFIMRKAGPAGLPVSPPGSRSEMNDHGAARAVHADQDVLGTPLRQMMRGAAPWLFHHEAPDSRNRWSPLLLLNLWIPLQQITRPLALMDARSLDRRAHQLRYGLPTDAFLDRDESRRVNDIWSFLHDPGQRWHFRSEMPLGQAYLFETLGTPHGSFVVPGEETARRRVEAVWAAREALERGDAAGLRRAAEAPQGAADETLATRPLRRAVAALDAVLAQARREAEALARGSGAEAWRARAEDTVQAVVRKSLEMRVVALRWPRLGSRPRSAA